jgi:predicted DNA-binding transcriptional regulator YafY
MTSVQLAEALEVSTRTILRDVDALTEAGLPVVVVQGVRGGIELGFNYRTRLTGLAADEAEALGVILGAGATALRDLGMSAAGQRAADKLEESLPDGVRARVGEARRMFGSVSDDDAVDPRVPALVAAVRGRRIVRIHARTEPREIHPVGLHMRGRAWTVEDGLRGEALDVAGLGDLNISSKTFAER